MKFKWKLLILKWVILSESLCFYPRNMRTSGFIVFLQIVFCFESLRLDNTKTALDLASRGKTYLVLMPVVFLFIFPLSVFFLFVTSLRKFIFRISFSATKELELAGKWQLFSFGWELRWWLFCKVYINFFWTSIWHCVKRSGFRVSQFVSFVNLGSSLIISGPQLPIYKFEH